MYNDDCQNAMLLLPLISRQRADNTADWRIICIALKKGQAVGTLKHHE